MKSWIPLGACCAALAILSPLAQADGGGHPPYYRGGGGYYHGGGGYYQGGGGYHGGGHGHYYGSLGIWFGAPLVVPFAYPYPYYYYDYYPRPPVVQQYVYPQAAPVAGEPQAPTWYYCRESRDYYPYVQNCPGGWESVPAKPPGPTR